MRLRKHVGLWALPGVVFLVLALQGCTPAPNCSVSEYVPTTFADTNDWVCSASDCSLREAVINANACPGMQTIRLPAGLYALTTPGSGEDAAATGDLDITDDLAIIGEGVPSIEAGDLDRVFEVFSPAVVSMHLLIIAEGTAPQGGAIYNHSDLTVTAGSIQRNVAIIPPGGPGSAQGGAIYNAPSATLTLDSTQAFTNQADFGGAIWNQGTLIMIHGGLYGNQALVSGGGLENLGSASLDEVTIDMNEADTAAGLFNQGTLNVADSTISRNQALTGSGGGVYNSAGGSTTIASTDIEDNVADVWGGGVFNTGPGSTLNMNAVTLTANEAERGGGLASERGMANVSFSTFTENAAVRGGAISNELDSQLILEDTRLTNNMADLGGGLYNRGLTHLYQSEVSINTAFAGFGGGIYNDGAFPGVLLRNVTVSGNMVVPPSAAGGAGIYNHGGDVLIEFATFAFNSPDGILNDSGGAVNLRSSVLAYHAGGNCAGVGSPSNGYNLETADTCGLIEPTDLTMTDPLLAPLAMNGGSTLNHALIPGSPAIDSGDPDMCVAIDQRGVTRPQGTQCDRGAYEDDSGVPVPISPTLGTVTGGICYPSEAVPPIKLHFDEVNLGTPHEFDHTDGSPDYSVDLPPGTYTAYAYVPSTTIGGTYSEFVLCGMTPSCIDHTLVEFSVMAGQTVADIDICDFSGDFSPPGEAQDQEVRGTFSKNANCRRGPSTLYAVVTSLLEGQDVLVEGRSEAGIPLWWWILLPESSSHCWVSDTTITVTGPIGELAVIAAPPLPPEAPAELIIADWMCNEKRYAVLLNWEDTSTNEAGFRVYRGDTLVATLDADATKYEDTPPFGGPYTYGVEAFNDSGVSARVTVQDQGCSFQ